MNRTSVPSYARIENGPSVRELKTEGGITAAGMLFLAAYRPFRKWNDVALAEALFQPEALFWLCGIWH